MIKVAILGATGYVGAELVRLLAVHPEAEIKYVVSHSSAGQKISEIYPNLRGVCDLKLTGLDIDKIAGECDVVFTALPHGASKEVIPKLYKKDIKIIDLSGDFRYNDPLIYKQWYGEEHCAPEILSESVYGLCELRREEIKKARLIGNPGCYTTCSILGIYPAIKEGLVDTGSIIIDAKSGVTGAGRGVALDYHFSECTENTRAYKIATHRHTSEIEQELSIAAGKDIMVSFTPHLIPQKRGIYATIYANLNKKVTTEQVTEIYNGFYKDEYFIRVYNSGIPETNHVAGSNFADIAVVADERLNRLIAVATIDNLYKGAAGQAIQNMNILFGIDEKSGIDNPGFYL